jgi:tetratricopeptide (TPR) repeat protein
LAWAQGDRSSARASWSQLPANSLIERGHGLLLQGDLERGRYLLQIVGEWYASDLSVVERSQLFNRLGDSYRLEGNWPQAIHYYTQALEVDSLDVEGRFHLGLSYRQNSQPDLAINLLEAGLEHLPSWRPGFVSTYLLQLGLAYKDVGRYASALAALRSAQEWLRDENPPWPDQQRFIDEQLKDLSHRLGIEQRQP